LTIARALEKANVTHVLTEKRDIAPDLGASIASFGTLQWQGSPLWSF